MPSLWWAWVLCAVPGPAPLKLTLEQAVERALAQNVSAQVASYEVSRAEGLLGEARAPALPTLGVTGLYTRLDADRVFGAAPPRVIASANQLSANAALALPLVAPGRWAQWAHGVEGVDVAQAGEADARRTVALTTARAYLSVVAQQRVIAVNERARDTARAHFQFSHARLAGGVGTRVDEVRAEQEVEVDEAQLQTAWVSLARAKEALSLLVAADGPVEVSAEPLLPDGPRPTEAVAEAEVQRTDLQAARKRADAADHLVRDSWLDWLPTLVGTFQPFYQNPPTLTQPQTGWQAQLILSVPIYEGSLRPAQRRERVALAGEAHAQLDAALRQAHSDVRLAYESLQRADQALAAAKRAADRAVEALELATRAYKEGATSNLEVIDAERRARDAENNAIIAEDSVRQARLDLLAATGHFP